MRHLKNFKNYRVNETLDLMTLPVDPLIGLEDIFYNFYLDLKENINSFIESVQNESDEVKIAFDLIIRASKGEMELNQTEIDFIYLKMFDLLKSIGIVSLYMIPGSTLVFMLVKFFKIEKYILPSSFN